MVAGQSKIGSDIDLAERTEVTPVVDNKASVMVEMADLQAASRLRNWESADFGTLTAGKD